MTPHWHPVLGILHLSHQALHLPQQTEQNDGTVEKLQIDPKCRKATIADDGWTPEKIVAPKKRKPQATIESTTRWH